MGLFRDADFRGQVVVITGGSRGIGLATARAFAERGAAIAICATDPQRLDEARDELAARTRTLARVVDITRPDQAEAFLEEVSASLGAVDCLVNNAGRARAGAYVDQPLEAIDAVIDANLKGLMYMTRLALPAMLNRGSGRVINVSSGAGLTGLPYLASYCASKFGVNGFTESLAQEVSSHGVDVFAVCPGRVATEMQEAVSGIRQGAAPDKVARAILRLAGPRPPVAPGTCQTIR